MRIISILALLFAINGLSAAAYTYNFSAGDGFEDMWANSAIGTLSELNKNAGVLAYTSVGNGYAENIWRPNFTLSLDHDWSVSVDINMVASLYEQSTQVGAFFSIQTISGAIPLKNLVFFHTSYESGRIGEYVDSIRTGTGVSDIEVTSMELHYSGSDQKLELLYTSKELASLQSIGSYGFGASAGTLGYLNDASQDYEEIQLVLGAFSEQSISEDEFSFDDLRVVVPEPRAGGLLMGGFILFYMIYSRSPLVQG